MAIRSVDRTWNREPLANVCIRRLESCPDIQRMNEQRKNGRTRGRERSYTNVPLVITPAMAAPAPVGPAASIIAPTAAVITAATIVPTTAV